MCHPISWSMIALGFWSKWWVSDPYIEAPPHVTPTRTRTCHAYIRRANSAGAHFLRSWARVGGKPRSTCDALRISRGRQWSLRTLRESVMPGRPLWQVSAFRRHFSKSRCSRRSGETCFYLFTYIFKRWIPYRFTRKLERYEWYELIFIDIIT